MRPAAGERRSRRSAATVRSRHLRDVGRPPLAPNDVTPLPPRRVLVVGRPVSAPEVVDVPSRREWRKWRAPGVSGEPGKAVYTRSLQPLLPISHEVAPILEGRRPEKRDHGDGQAAKVPLVVFLRSGKCRGAAG